MMIAFFICFVALYRLVITRPVAPFYLKGLWFGLPVLCFAAIVALAITGNLGDFAANIISALIIAPCILFSVGYLSYLSVEAATTEITNIQYYNRTLHAVGYPNIPGTSHFPGQIPKDAQNIQFSYHQAMAQGGEELHLKFTVDADQMNQYKAQFLKKASWIGFPRNCETEETGIHESFLYVFDYEKELPRDLTLYLMYSKPYRQNDWNHGKLGLAAISEENNEVFFLFEDW
jgi:hypothetical protein